MRLNLQTRVNDPIVTFVTEALQLKLLARQECQISVLNVDIRYPDRKEIRTRFGGYERSPNFVIAFSIPGSRGQNTRIRALGEKELFADVYQDLNRRTAMIYLSSGVRFNAKLEASETLARSVVDDVLTLLAA